MSGITNLAELTTEGIRRLAESNPWPPASLRVFIAPRDEMYGLGRMYQALAGAESENMRVVRSGAEALAWMTQKGHAP